MEWLYTFMEEWGYGALFLTMVLENLNIPIPSEIVLGFAGFLVHRGIFTYLLACIVGTLAGLVGSLLSYAVGYYGGRPILLRYGKFVLLSHTKLHMADDWFHRYGGIAVFTGRLLPGVRTFISLPAGMAKYPLRPFIMYTILGTIPWTMLLIWAGYMLGEHWQELLRYDFELAVASLVIVALAYLVYRHRRKRAAQEENMAVADKAASVTMEKGGPEQHE